MVLSQGLSHEAALGIWAGECSHLSACLHASRVAHSLGCWQEASVPHHLGLSKSCSNVLTIIAAVLQEQVTKNKVKATVSFIIDHKDTYHHFCHILFIRSESLSPGHSQAGSGN